MSEQNSNAKSASNFFHHRRLCFRFGKMMSLLWCFDSRPCLDLKRDRNQELLDGRPGVRSSANYRDEGCIQLVSSASSVASTIRKCDWATFLLVSNFPCVIYKIIF